LHLKTQIDKGSYLLPDLPILPFLHDWSLNDNEIGPYTDIKFGETLTSALINTGLTKSEISEELYRSIIHAGYVSLQLPVQMIRGKVVFACGCSREDTVIKCLLKFQINGDIFENDFTVRPYLPDPVMSGTDFLQKKHVIIDFFEKCLWKVEKEGRRRYKFSSTTGDMEEKDRDIETNGGHTDHWKDASLSSLPECPAYPASPSAEPVQSVPLSDLHTHLKINKAYKEIEFGETRLLAYIDTGAESSTISEAAYQSIIATGYANLQFPVDETVLDSNFHAQRIKTRIVLEFKIDGDIFEYTFLVTPKSVDPVILGADFLQENNIVIDIQRACFWKGGKEDDRRYMFSS
jgi:hypothetical protein